MLFDVKHIARQIKQTAELIPEELPLYISKYLKSSSQGRGFAKSMNKNLQDKTGTLYRSFTPRDKNNITDIKYNSDGVQITYGSKLPYASIHETGAFIKATPVTVIRKYKPTTKKYNPIKNAKITMGEKRTPFQTFQMARYFWAMYYKTEDENYKYTALSVHKLGGVKIPKREYFAPAMKDFEREGLPIILNEFLNNILSGANG